MPNYKTSYWLTIHLRIQFMLPPHQIVYKSGSIQDGCQTKSSVNKAGNPKQVISQ